MKKYDNNIKKVFELLSLNNDYSIIGSSKNNPDKKVEVVIIDMYELMVKLF